MQTNLSVAIHNYNKHYKLSTNFNRLYKCRQVLQYHRLPFVIAFCGTDTHMQWKMKPSVTFATFNHVHPRDFRHPARTMYFNNVFVLIRPAFRLVRLTGNIVISPSSRHFIGCCLIESWLNRNLPGCSLCTRAVANAIAKSPQS